MVVGNLRELRSGDFADSGCEAGQKLDTREAPTPRTAAQMDL